MTNHHYRLLAVLLAILPIFIIFSISSCKNKAGEESQPESKKFPVTEETPLIEVTAEDELEYLKPKVEGEVELKKFYTVQMGAFSNLENAHKTLSDLKGRGYDVFLFENTSTPQTLYKVGLGAFENKEAAEEYLTGLKVPGYEGMWITMVRSGPEPEDGSGESSTEPESTWKMAFISDRGDGWGVWYMRKDKEPVLLAEGDRSLKRPMISPDGMKVAFIRAEDGGSEGKISVVDTYGSKEEFVIPSPLPLSCHLWVTSDTLAYVSTKSLNISSSKIIIYDVLRKEGEVIFSTDKYTIGDLSLSPDGIYLAYHASLVTVGEDTDEAIHVGVIDLKTGEKSVIRAGYTTRFLGWYPDDSLLVAYHAEPGEGDKFDYSFARSDPKGKDIVIMEDLDSMTNVGRGVTSPDGNFIAFLTWVVDKESKVRTTKELWLFDLKESKTKRLLRKDSLIYGLAWSPDSKELGFTSKVNTKLNVFIVKDIENPVAERFSGKEDNTFDIDWR